MTTTSEMSMYSNLVNRGIDLRYNVRNESTVEDMSRLQVKKYLDNKKKISKDRPLFYLNISSPFLMKNGDIYNSSSPSITRHPLFQDKYIINTRFVNYRLDVFGSSNIGNKNCKTINKIAVLDKNFNCLTSKYLFPRELNKKFVGIEDIRLFGFQNELYFIGSYYNPKNDKIQIVSNKFNLFESYIPKIIEPTFATRFDWEKNWVFFKNNNKLNVIYQWSPIYICEIDYDSQKLNLTKSIENVPPIFNKFRGSTCGIEYDDKIWFIVHQRNSITDTINSYEHNFVVFDKNMKLVGYSNAFKFQNVTVEFCVGLELTYNNNFVITYSTLDSTSNLIVVSPDYVKRLLICV